MKLILPFILVLSLTQQQEECTINSVFRTQLKCDFSRPDGKVKDAALLIHMLGRTKEDYNGLIALLKENQIAAFSFNLPGHPKPPENNKEEKALDWRDFKEKDFKKMILDVRKAVIKMKKMCQWEKEDISIIGTELGANLAVYYLQKYGGVKKVVLISPALNIKGIDLYSILKKNNFPDVKFLLVSDTGHTYFYYSALKIKKILDDNAITYFVNRNLIGAYLLSGIYGVEEKIIKFLKGKL